MDNVVVLTSESDSDYEDEKGDHSDREEEIYESEHFMNHVVKKEYEITRNRLFTKDIETIDIAVDSFQETSNKNNYTFKLFSNNETSGGLGEYKNVIGCELITGFITQRADNTQHLLDICVPNIPYKACINNSNGRHVLARTYMKVGSNQINLYEPSTFPSNNYFFPISLTDMKIELYYIDTDSSDTDLQLYDSTRNNSFVFRLTLLNNLDILK